MPTKDLPRKNNSTSSDVSNHQSAPFQMREARPLDWIADPSEDEAKREQLFDRFFGLKGELGDVFVEIESGLRNCLDWGRVSNDEGQKEAWEHSRKAWERLDLELRWALVFHNFGFLPSKHRKQFLKKLNREYCKPRKPTRGKRGRRSLLEDKNERLLMTKLAWWNFVQNVSLGDAADKLKEQGVPFYRDQAHKTQYVTTERKRAVEAIYKTLSHHGLMPARMEGWEIREGKWYAKEDLDFSTCRNLKEILSRKWTQKELSEEYGLPFSDDPSTNLELSGNLYFPGTNCPDAVGILADAQKFIHTVVLKYNELVIYPIFRKHRKRSKQVNPATIS